jgi:hypothetical protein
VLTAATEARPDDAEAARARDRAGHPQARVRRGLAQLTALEQRAEDHAARAAVLLRVGRWSATCATTRSARSPPSARPWCWIAGRGGRRARHPGAGYGRAGRPGPAGHQRGGR